MNNITSYFFYAMSKQKTIQFLLAFALISSIFLFKGGFAYAAPPKTIFEGTVTMPGPTPVSGANILIVCSHGAVSHQLSTTTGANGKYHLEFSIPNCTPNSHVVLTATKGSFSKSVTGSAGNPNDITVLDVLFQTAAVPEFGMISGVVAMIASAGYALKMRRRIV